MLRVCRLHFPPAFPSFPNLPVFQTGGGDRGRIRTRARSELSPENPAGHATKQTGHRGGGEGIQAATRTPASARAEVKAEINWGPNDGAACARLSASSFLTLPPPRQKTTVALPKISFPAELSKNFKRRQSCPWRKGARTWAIAKLGPSSESRRERANLDAGRSSPASLIPDNLRFNPHGTQRVLSLFHLCVLSIVTQRA